VRLASMTASKPNASVDVLKNRQAASKIEMMKQWIVAGGAMLVAAVWCGGAGGITPAAAETGSSQADPAAQVAHGKTLFISYGCGWCHEDGGRKAGKCPQLMGSERDDSFILTRIATGSAGKMPAFGEALSGPDIQALLAYIRSLKPETTP
jgi:mono/diheme cytochrome c family protein